MGECVARKLKYMILRSSHQICKRHAAFGAGVDGPRIEHAITHDLPDGRPTLPPDDDESLWFLVASRSDGTKRWRRIIPFVQKSAVEEAAP
jgi:hypothetical protein